MEKRIEELDKNFKAQELKGGFLYRDVYACENVVAGGRADAGHAGVGYVPYAPEREQRP